MRAETRAIGAACALGGLIGAFVALEISRRFEVGRYLWTVGLPIGGLIGYIAYDVKGLLGGVALAWREILNWRLDWRHFATLAFRLICFGAIVSSLVFYSTTLVLTALWLHSYTYVLVPLLTIFVSMILLSAAVLLVAIVDFRAAKDQSAWTRSKVLLFPVVLGNPIVLPVTFLALLVMSVWPLVVFVRRGTLLTVRFLKRTFLYVHSHKRLLCLIDASIGVTIGYLLGNAFVGGVAGLLIGVVNYELISVRILQLKLKPLRPS